MFDAAIFLIIVFFAACANSCARIATFKHYNKWDAYVEGWLFTLFALFRYEQLRKRPAPPEALDAENPSATEEVICPVCGKQLSVGEAGRFAPTGHMLHLDCAERFLPKSASNKKAKPAVPHEIWGSPRFCRALMVYIPLHAVLIASILLGDYQLLSQHSGYILPSLEYIGFWDEMNVRMTRGPRLADQLTMGSVVMAIGVMLLSAGLWIAHDLRRMTGIQVCILLFPLAAASAFLLASTIFLALWMRIAYV